MSIIQWYLPYTGFTLYRHPPVLVLLNNNCLVQRVSYVHSWIYVPIEYISGGNRVILWGMIAQS